jgi:hypothetical protein
VDQHNPAATTSSYSWLTYDSSLGQIMVDTSTPVIPESIQLSVRYYNNYLTESYGYYDHNIHIRIYQEANITASD